MARPCLVTLKARAVLAAAGSDTLLDPTTHRIPVTGVDVTVEGEVIDRSDVYTPNGLGLGSITTARKTQFVITQEVYGSVLPHAVLLGACANEVNIIEPDGTVAYVTPSESTCEGSGFVPCTIEVIEIGGNVYRATDCTGVFTLAGEPGTRQIFTFTMTGHFVMVADNTYGPLAVVPVGLPLLYKNSRASFQIPDEVDRLNLASCPAYEFTSGAELVDVPSACAPDGAGWDYPVATGPSTLVFSGVVSRKESIDKLWDLAVNPKDGVQFSAAFTPRDPAIPGIPGFGITFSDATILDPAPTDVQGFAGYDVTVQGPQWVMTWDFNEEP